MVAVMVVTTGCGAEPSIRSMPFGGPRAGQPIGQTGALLASVPRGNTPRTGNPTPVLTTRAFEVVLYELRRGIADSQTIHNRDEIYVYLSGHGEMDLDGDQIGIHRGSVVFVGAGVPHRLTPQPSLRAVVVFMSPASPGGSRSQVAAVPRGGLRRADENEWHPLISQGPIRGGAYLLPVIGGGDAPQVHAVGEINVVLAGSGDFRVGDEEPVHIGPGSVMYVPAGIPHSFETLTVDLLDLIFFSPG
jgi:mannose-6-phosphate isomerase-like protein (cupin superfamily)